MSDDKPVETTEMKEVDVEEKKEEVVEEKKEEVVEETKEEPKEEKVEVKEPEKESAEGPKHLNRWFIVLGAILIQLALGSIYSWGTLSVFVSNPGWMIEPKTTTLVVFVLGLLFFAITMIFAGRLQQKIGPMKTTWIGGAVVCLGVMTSAAANGSLAALSITYGVIFGCGIGFGYVCPIAASVRWFPDKKGLINGLAVAGFGAGAFIFNNIIKALANPVGLDRTDPGYHDEMVKNVPITFVVIGIIETALIFAGSFFMILPPEGYKVPGGWTPPPVTAAGPSRHSYQPGAVIKTGQFWLLWSLFVLSATSGLMVIGSYASFAQQTDPNDATTFSYPFVAALQFAIVGGMASLFNAMGRIAWGKLCDAFGYRLTMMIMFTLQGGLALYYFWSASSATMYINVTELLFFCFGGNFSIFPTATTDLFGPKFLGPNYGMVFTAYGIAAVVGGLLTALVVPVTKNYMVVFVIFGVMSLIATVGAYFLKPLPQKTEEEAEK